MARTLIDYGFTELGIHRIFNSVGADNDRSVKLMRRLGFRLETSLFREPRINGILDYKTE